MGLRYVGSVREITVGVGQILADLEADESRRAGRSNAAPSMSGRSAAAPR